MIKHLKDCNNYPKCDTDSKGTNVVGKMVLIDLLTLEQPQILNF